MTDEMVTKNSAQKLIISSAAKRIADRYAQFKVDKGHDANGQWFAARLDDGTSDGVLYHSKSAAMRHQQSWEKYYIFIQIGPWPMPAHECEALLRVQRRAYDAGIRFSDPDAPGGGKDIIQRVNADDQYNQIRALFGRGKPSNISFGVPLSIRRPE